MSTAPKNIPTELEEHLMLVKWLTRNGVFFIHIPNEGKRSINQAVTLKRMGMTPGAPDIMLPGNRIAIELKRSKRSLSRVSPEQKECLRKLSECGWNTFIAYGASEAIQWLEKQPLTKTPLKRIL